ncbi:MAG: SEFIR domain-containing protein [Thiolinea sp.]
MTKVFISYSHDSEPHKQFVLELSKRLRDEGLDCQIDRYLNGSPSEGWQRWMETQIEQADFVLLICTPDYLKRYRGEEREKGKGVTFEGLVIANTLYQHYYQNTKFIPVIPAHGSSENVPVPLQAYSTYTLPRDYETLYRVLTGQAEYVMPALGEIRKLSSTKTRINSGELPTVEGELFGRKDELALLDQALADSNMHIVQFIAPGGTGKTKLLQHWLDENKHKIEAQLIHSFYSQGSSEDKQISSTPFFIQALKALGSNKGISDFQTEEEKAEHIAELLRKKRCLLVLDGLEPLQQVARGMRGELKDRAIRRLLRQLANDHSSLCIITTRVEVHELKNRKAVLSHDLQNLAPEDGVKLLRSFEVQGREVDMLAAVNEYGCHALALHLLGNAVATYLNKDIRQRDTLPELIGDYDYIERHAFKVMQAYQHWLAGTVELKLLYLLSLFDHPIEQEVLQVLWEAQIPELTADVTERDWKAAQRVLEKEYRMMSVHAGQAALFDCHPLIREYFGRQLKENHGEVWRQAHTVLYEYYKALPEKLYGKYLPDTLEEMQPLFRAVAHGCLAELYLQSWVEVVWPRIEQQPEVYLGNFYLVDTLGAWKDALSLISNYFDTPWISLKFETISSMENNFYNRAASYLNAAGRYSESIEAQNKAILAANLDGKSLDSLVINSCSLTETMLNLGLLNKAKENLKNTINFAVQANTPQAKITALCVTGRVYHQQNLIKEVLWFFEEAEKIHSFSTIPFLHSIPGAYLCEILIDLNRVKEAKSRAARALKKCGASYSKISLFHDQLILCKSWLKEGNKLQTAAWLKKAKISLNYLDIPHHLIEYYFVYVNFEISEQHYLSAASILQETYEIAEPSGMCLHLTDYHLEMARLILAIEADKTQYPEATPDREQRILPFDTGECGEILTLEQHIEKAAKLIKETGYHRRDAELAELKRQANLMM